MKTLEQQVYDADKAREVLENEAFQQVFTDIEQELMTAWADSPIRDLEGREKIFQALTMLKKVQSSLVKTFDSGKLAMKELEHKRTLRERARDAIWPE